MSSIFNFRKPVFYQASFTLDFNEEQGDEVFISYNFPYSFSRLSRVLRKLKAQKSNHTFLKETILCPSLSGIDVPYLIVTTRVNQSNYDCIDPAADNIPKDRVCKQKKKRVVVVIGRVHPGESNSSFMMEGFIKFITSSTNSVAIELRKRIIFRIIPITNPDGVIAGNYRVSMSGNDLNRRYQSPH